MYRILITFFLTLAISGFAYCQSFTVREVSGDTEEAVLYDGHTGEELTVRVGHETEGWVITEITPDHVTITKPGEEGGPTLVTEIPVKSGMATVETIPAPGGMNAE
ncbi:hypothetical protein [Desulfonema magnum]|uniref:SH3 domain-containing protein n=1 Tax=Desulfonema magnum TaxID=45655 RepID=A0A975BEB4_9BACT|nr:hypothetical protein [Desulfonema magnum]QTA84124.1 Uncharacterized protein dnm_001170 [Desulfonema magnum]